MIQCNDAMPASLGAKNLHVKMRASAAVAQLDRVLGYEPRGRGFDSCQPHHIYLCLACCHAKFFFGNDATRFALYMPISFQPMSHFFA